MVALAPRFVTEVDDSRVYLEQRFPVSEPALSFRTFLFSCLSNFFSTFSWFVQNCGLQDASPNREGQLCEHVAINKDPWGSAGCPIICEVGRVVLGVMRKLGSRESLAAWGSLQGLKVFSFIEVHLVLSPAAFC